MRGTDNITGHDDLLTETQAADFLRLSVRTLQAWRVSKRGPDFVKVGRAVRYRRRDLVAWLRSNTVSCARLHPAVDTRP